MTNNELNHNKTPPELRAVNDELIAALSAEEPDNIEATLLDIVSRRDAIVQQHLASLSTDDAREFAHNEVPINDKLLELVQTLLDSAKDDITHFMRSRAAVKKYK
ncbi:hypothetical protein [Alteromonas halophila]|uniref:Uncharacterized protein n=1 Tax=Alteromonas halophila TaxID=516698 RepID=A0A918MVE7_9ALTE|nr:hypothetical protein [Alteromonas halophila]GGW73474.1 hypothetical protein GCM10007391_01420 [Alteromonas halophila]